MGSSLARPATVGVPDAAATGGRRHRFARARGLGARRRSLAFAAMWASPVAGVFLCTAAPARRSPAARRPRGAAGSAPALRRRVRDRGCCSPRAAPDRFAATAFWPMLALSRRRRRCCSPRAGATVLRGRGCCTSPCSSARSSSRPRSARTRCGSACCWARRCSRSAPHRRAPSLALRGRRRRAARLPAVAAGRARGGRGARRPGDARRPSRPRRALPRAAWRKPGERVEVPLTRNHWEAADLAPGRPAGPRLGAPARPGGQPDSSTTTAG